MAYLHVYTAPAGALMGPRQLLRLLDIMKVRVGKHERWDAFSCWACLFHSLPDAEAPRRASSMKSA